MTNPSDEDYSENKNKTPKVLDDNMLWVIAKLYIRRSSNIVDHDYSTEMATHLTDGFDGAGLTSDSTDLEIQKTLRKQITKDEL